MKIIGESLVRSKVASGNGDDGRTSEKLITDTGDNELNLSVYTVMSIEDLLIEILLRLPVVSLLLFKTVSKHWLSIIKSPNFTSRLSRIPNMAPPSGIFLKRCKGKVQHEFLSLDSRISSKRSIAFSFCSEADRSVQILNSCNGLLLFRGINYPYKLYVYNPSINLYKTLPQPQNLIDTGFREIMAFDPTKSPPYKLDIVGNTISTTRLPKTLATRGAFIFKLFQSRGCLLLLCKQYTHSRQLVVYEMRNWNSGWSVKYLINLNDIVNPFPKNWNLYDCVWCIVLREKEEDSFMVMKVCGKVVQYKPVQKTSRELRISGSKSIHRSYEFTASFAGVLSLLGNIWPEHEANTIEERDVESIEIV
ncbi:F-box protein-like protein isoform X1 [Tanacetum coccineum]